MRKEYATALTRDYLEYLGITEVSKDGTKIMKGDTEVKQHFDGRYYNINLYDPGVRKQTPAEKRKNNTGQFVLGVHRVVYAWYNRIAPTGFVIDHINNDKTDNRLDNLQLFTPQQNINKDKEESNREIKCKLDRPRTYFEEKLEKYMALYEEAKAAHDADETHKQRTNIANIKARLRYFDNHIEEHERIIRLKKEIELIKYLKKEFKAKGDTIRWHQFRQLEVQWATIEEKLRSQILDSVMKYCI